MPKRIKKTPPRKIALRVPDLDHLKTFVLNSLCSPRSRRNYKFAMDQFIAWPFIRTAFSATLEHSGYRVRTAKDGIEALELLDGRTSDVVNSDMIYRCLGCWDLSCSTSFAGSFRIYAAS